MQVHRQHAVRAGRAEQVRHQLGRDRHARLVLAILPRVAVVRNHRRDARRRRAAERVDHHAQLHDGAGRRARRSAARRRHRCRGCSRRSETRPPCPETAAAARARSGRRRKSAISSASAGCALPENSFSWPPVIVGRLVAPVVIAGHHWSHGRPSTSSEQPTHVEWLGREDSNLRIRDPKSRALPLGHAPSRSGAASSRPESAAVAGSSPTQAQPQGAARQACPQKVKSSRFHGLLATGRARRSYSARRHGAGQRAPVAPLRQRLDHAPAAARLRNSPKTADPLPDIAAATAPASRSAAFSVADFRMTADDRRLEIVDHLGGAAWATAPAASAARASPRSPAARSSSYQA